MGGVYFHIPFCRHKCLYCNFFSVADFRRREQIVAAMRDELCGRAEGWPDREVKTGYFGGGTPSLLPAEDIFTLLEAVKRSMRLSPDAEITLEANPDSAGDWKALRALRRCGFNRISLGMQSACDEELRTIGRVHTMEQVQQAVEAARKAKIQNLSLDLIYGLPHQTQ